MAQASKIETQCYSKVISQVKIFRRSRVNFPENRTINEVKINHATNESRIRAKSI